MSDFYVAIWKLTALRKEDYVIVPSNQIKHFHPKDEDDFVAKQLYKYKPPGAERSTQVFILAVSEGKESLKLKMSQSRIQYPNRRNVCASSSTTEDDAVQKVREKEIKIADGRKRNAESILSAYKLKSLGESSGTKQSMPVTNSSSKRAAGASSSLDKESSVLGAPNSSGGQASEASSSQIKEYSQLVPGIIEEDTDSSQPCSCSPDIRALKEQVRLLQQDKAEQKGQLEEVFEKRFSELKIHMVEAFEQEVSGLKSEMEDSFEQEVAKLKHEMGEAFTAEKQELRKFLNETEKNVAGPSKKKPKVIHKFIHTTNSEKDPTQGHLSTVQLVDIGHGVMADNDIWSSIDTTTTKDDWAYAALLAVFGEQAKYYRVRRPRSKDEDLRVFPTKPPILFVLEHYYKKWLKSNPTVLDEQPKPSKGKTFELNAEEWLGVLEAENEGERATRRLATMTTLVKHLGGLLGDKATNMYRSAVGRSQAPSEESDSDSASVMTASSPPHYRRSSSSSSFST